MSIALHQSLISGKILQSVPGEVLQHSFRFDSETHRGVSKDGSRVTYRITTNRDETTLTLTHDQFGDDMQTYENVKYGWPIILQGLKHRLEQGH